MTESKHLKSFKLISMKFPNQHLEIRSEASIVWDEPKLFVHAIILDQDKVQFRFAIQLVAGEVIKDDALKFDALAEVECAGEFKYIGVELPVGLETIDKIPLAANMLASLFPYIRERVSNLLGANRINHHLPSMNIVGFVANMGKQFAVEDRRLSK